MIWRAAVAADKGERIEAAEILEHAARQLRQTGDSRTRLCLVARDQPAQ
jgi:hypothetical protein